MAQLSTDTAKLFNCTKMSVLIAPEITLTIVCIACERVATIHTADYQATRNVGVKDPRDNFIPVICMACEYSHELYLSGRNSERRPSMLPEILPPVTISASMLRSWPIYQNLKTRVGCMILDPDPWVMVLRVKEFHRLRENLDIRIGRLDYNGYADDWDDRYGNWWASFFGRLQTPMAGDLDDLGEWGKAAESTPRNESEAA
jgi:hypothetical protein